MKPSILLIIIVIMCGVPKLSAQQKSPQSLKDIYLDAEYFFVNEEYEEALFSYNTILKRGYSNNANINYRVGQCYLNVPGSKHLATAYLEKAVKNVSDKYVEGSLHEVKAPLEAWFYLGNAYRINNRLDKAIEAYEKYKSLIGSKAGVAYRLANKEIEACKNAAEMMQHPAYVYFMDLKAPINSPSKDFFPAVSGNDSVMVFNRSQKFYDAIMYSKRVNNKWSEPINITADIQSDGNQYVSSLSYDGTELFLRKEDSFEANIMVAHFENGKWSVSKPLNKNINTKFWEGNACVSKDGNTLYFSSNKSGGVGALDLYKSVKQKNGEWGPAENLGKTINTEFNEDEPILTENGKRLYFVSQGHKTMGGYDIFYSDLGEDGKWKEPVNLGFPINTTDDDLHFYPILNGKIAYQGLYSKEGLGNEDIFLLQLSSDFETKTMGNEENLVDSSTTVALKRIEVPQENVVRELPADVEKVLVKEDTAAVAVDNIVLHPIFFDFNSIVLNDNAKRDLNYMILVLQKYPEMDITLQGNTDAKGSDTYNKVLSENRAKAVRDYMIENGIDEKRLTIMGLAKGNFIAINQNDDGSDNPIGRKFNRRVDLKITNPPKNVVITELIKIPNELKVKH